MGGSSRATGPFLSTLSPWPIHIRRSIVWRPARDTRSGANVLRCTMRLVRMRAFPRDPVPNICGCRSKFGVPLSITPDVPFIYLRLRKKLGASYSAIRPKRAGNRKFWAEHVARMAQNASAPASALIAAPASGPNARQRAHRSRRQCTQRGPPHPIANSRVPPCFERAKPPLPCSFGSDSYKTQRILPRKTVCVGQGSPGECGPGPAESLGK